MNTNAINQLSPDRDTQIRDAEHLKILGICHYVLGGITAAYSTMFLLHFGFGLMMVLHPQMWGHGTNAPPPFFGWLFLIVGAVFTLSGWTTGALMIYSGRLIRQRRRRLFSQIVAGISCTLAPLGTALGIFTLLVLARPSVKAVYEPAALSPMPAHAPGAADPDEGVWLELEKRASQADSGKEA